MRIFFRLLIKLLPVLMVVLVLIYIISQFGWSFQTNNAPKTSITHNTILEKIESLGKLELVKYSFQEVTTLTERNERYLGIFPSGDSKVILISHGEAVGCIDLTKIRQEDIRLTSDSLIVTLPMPEICYHKLNLDKTRIYSVEKGVYYRKESELVEKAYQLAEAQIKKAALEADILVKTQENAAALLMPFFKEISEKKVYFSHTLDTDIRLQHDL